MCGCRSRTQTAVTKNLKFVRLKAPSPARPEGCHLKTKTISKTAAGIVCLFSFSLQRSLSSPFRELLRCEGALARLYCRMALLNIFAPKNPHTFTRLFHIPAIRDITLEHLQLLSNQLLAPPLPGELCFSFYFIFFISLGQCTLIDM